MRKLPATSDEAESLESEAPELVQMRKDVLRERRLVDQGLTMHALLRDSYHRRAVGLTCLVLVASVVGIAFAFAGNEQTYAFLRLHVRRTTLLGWLAVVTFCVSLIDLVTDSRGAARRHGDAVVALSKLKADYSLIAPASADLAALRRLHDRYQGVMGSVPPVPERLFNRLKARHLQKVQISKILSETEGLTHRGAKRRLREKVR